MINKLNKLNKNNLKKILIKKFFLFYLILLCIFFYFFLINSTNFIHCGESIYDLLYSNKDEFSVIKRYFFFSRGQSSEFLKSCSSNNSTKIIWFSNPQEFYNSKTYKIWKHFFLIAYYVCYNFNNENYKPAFDTWPEIFDLIKLQNPFTGERLIVGIKNTSPENELQKAFINNRMIYQRGRPEVPDVIMERVHISEFTSFHDRHLLRHKKAIFCLLSPNQEKKFLEDLFKKKINV